MDCINVVNIDSTRKNINALGDCYDIFEGKVSSGFSVSSNRVLHSFNIILKDASGNTQTREIRCNNIKTIEAQCFAFNINKDTSIIFDMEPGEEITIIFDTLK